jgi:hypothetical protein
VIFVCIVETRQYSPAICSVVVGMDSGFFDPITCSFGFGRVESLLPWSSRAFSFEQDWVLGPPVSAIVFELDCRVLPQGSRVDASDPFAAERQNLFGEVPT